MAIDWNDVRYRGDARDVQDLLDTYRVADYLETFEENRRKQDFGVREMLLKDGIRLSERLSPRIYALFGDVCRALGLAATAEVFCLPSSDLNAYALLDTNAPVPLTLVGITSAALERLDDGELRAVLGHELGHFLFGTNRLLGLLSNDANNPSVTVLPPMGESLFLRWRKKAELSADRAGMLAAGDFAATARALLKVSFGLSEKNLELDIEALMAQIEEIKGHPELVAAEFSTHPLLPIRLKALEIFSRSAKAVRAGFAGAGTVGDDALEDEVDALVRLTRRYPTRPVHLAVMRCVAAGGALLLAADGDVSDDEIKVLVQSLHHFFTDEPEGEIETDRGRNEAKLAEAAAVINAEGDESDKLFVLSRLADIALADGALMDEEGGVILEIGQRLDVPPKTAYATMIAAAQSVGFRTDARLNRIADGLRKSLETGFARR